MKNLKQKPYEEDETKEHQGGDITQLDGSPDPTAVSRVAMGGDAKTDAKHTDIYNTEWIKRLMGKDSEDHEDSPDGYDEVNSDDINDAYAKLFEGLAGIMRCK